MLLQKLPNMYIISCAWTQHGNFKVYIKVWTSFPVPELSMGILRFMFARVCHRKGENNIILDAEHGGKFSKDVDWWEVWEYSLELWKPLMLNMVEISAKNI